MSNRDISTKNGSHYNKIQKVDRISAEDNKEKYRSIFENSFDAVLIIDEKNYKFVEANQQACSLFQYTKEQFTQFMPNDICSAKQEEINMPFEVFLKENKANLIQNNRVSFNLNCKRADGSEMKCMTLISYVESKSSWIIVTIRDLTKSIEVEKKIQEQSRSLKEAQKIARMGKWEYDFKTEEIQWSDQLYIIFGMVPQKEKLTTKKLIDFIPQEYYEVIKSYVRKAIATGEPYHLEHPITLKDGTTKWIGSIGRIITDEDNQPEKLTGIFQDITSKKNTALELRKVQKNYYSVFQNSRLGICLTDHKTGKIEYNPAFLNLFGYPKAELDWLKTDDYTVKEDLVESQKKMKQLRAGEITSFNVKKRYRKKDGSVFHANTLVSANYGETGEINTSIAIVDELTNHKFVVDALESVSNDLALIPGETFFDVLVKRISETLNVPYVMISEYRKQDNSLFVKSLWKETNIIKDFSLNLQNVFCEKIILSKEVKVFNKGAKRIFPCSKILNNLNFVSYLGLPIVNSQNKLIGNIAIMDNKPLENIHLSESILKIYSSRISSELERSVKEGALKASEHRYKALFENAIDGIMIFDLNTSTRIQCNANLPKMLGCDMDEYLEAPFGTFMPEHQSNGELSTEIMANNIKTIKDKGFHRFDWITKRKNGETILTEITAVLLPPPDDNLIVLMLKDITESTNQKNAIQQKVIELNDKNKQLQKYIDSNMQLENFAYIASHDLKEPLRTIGNFTQLLKKRYESQFDNTANEFMNFIIEGVQNMNRMIEDLLTYSRVNSQGYKRENLNLTNTLFLILRNLSNIIEEKQGRVNIHNIPELIIGDKTKISQLFQNLIANGLKFHRKDIPPVIEIKGEDKGDFWQFSVSDNGIGIKPEHFDNIFKLFKKLHSKSQYLGTGIGLSLCKQIVEQHDGRIWVDSVLDKGTTFHFTICKVVSKPIDN